MDTLNQILSINNGGAYGGGKAGGAFDPLTFAMKPQVVIRALCWVSNSSFRAPSIKGGSRIRVGIALGIAAILWAHTDSRICHVVYTNCHSLSTWRKIDIILLYTCPKNNTPFIFKTLL